MGENKLQLKICTNIAKYDLIFNRKTKCEVNIMSMPNSKKTAIRVQKVRLYPDAEMKQVLNELCDYRRYCWNEALALWNDMYEQSLIPDDKKSRPSEYKVRNELVAEKRDWQYALSARVLPKLRTKPPFLMICP